MATILPVNPPPPDPRVQRFTADGRPTPAQVTYETKLKAFLDAVKQWIEAQP